MQTILAQKENFVHAINTEVLHRFDRKLNLKGLICYGSRVAGGARKDSDFDMMAVVEADDGEDFYGEFHGTLRLQEKLAPVEIRIYSLERLQQLLTGQDPKRLYALKQSCIVFDNKNELSHFKNAAIQKYADLIKEFKTELLSLKSDEILPILQITASEQYKIARHLMDTKQSVAALFCFFEFLVDYLVCVEGCLKNISEDETCISNLYFLRTEKGGRFFNIEKYPWPKHYQELIRNLNSCLSLSAPSLESAFSILDRHFGNLFNMSLILTEDKWPSVCLR